MRIYICQLCGAVLMSLRQLVLHFEIQHPDLLPSYYHIFKLEGKRLGLWRVYRDLRDAGLVRGGTR